MHGNFHKFIFSGSAWNFDDDTDSTTSSETMTTGSDDVSVNKSPMPLYYTTPPKAVSLLKSYIIYRHVRIIFVDSHIWEAKVHMTKKYLSVTVIQNSQVTVMTKLHQASSCDMITLFTFKRFKNNLFIKRG